MRSLVFLFATIVFSSAFAASGFQGVSIGADAECSPGLIHEFTFDGQKNCLKPGVSNFITDHDRDCPGGYATGTPVIVAGKPAKTCVLIGTVDQYSTTLRNGCAPRYETVKKGAGLLTCVRMGATARYVPELGEPCLGSYRAVVSPAGERLCVLMDAQDHYVSTLNVPCADGFATSIEMMGLRRCVRSGVVQLYSTPLANACAPGYASGAESIGHRECFIPGTQPSYVSMDDRCLEGYVKSGPRLLGLGRTTCVLPAMNREYSPKASTPCEPGFRAAVSLKFGALGFKSCVR